MKILAVTIGRCSGCSIMIDGKIVYAVSEEKFSRIKSDESYPKLSIDNALSYCKIQPNELDKVLIAGNRIAIIPPLLRVYTKFSVKDHLKMMKDYWYPKLINNESISMLDVFRDRIDLARYPLDQPFASELNVETIEHPVTPESDEKISNFFKMAISNQLGISTEKIIHVEHDTCHAYYGFYGSPIRDDNTLIFTADAWGDDLSGTISIFDKQNQLIKRVKEYSHRDFQLARLYRYTTLLLHMIPNEHEYKVMGLAPYYNGSKVQEVESIFDKMLTLEGLDFKFDSSIKDIFQYLKENLDEFRFDHIAAGIQSFTEKMLVEWFSNALEKYNSDTVVFSGGVSLNIKANLLISKIDKLKKFFVCGGGGDETLPIGACYSYAEKNKIPPEPLKNLYLGSDTKYTDDELKIFEKYKITEFKNIEQILDLILQNKIIATCRGRLEMGPRSLGNRSILADPRIGENIEKINRMIKNRDFWMPFAPIILHEKQELLINNPKNLESPHMTIAFETKDGKKKFPAAVHQADGTARPQILKKDVNPEIWELINAFFIKTGVPSLLNTSFNLHGEPIVNDIKDALHVFENSQLDALWLDNHVIEKNASNS